MRDTIASIKHDRLSIIRLREKSIGQENPAILILTILLFRAGLRKIRLRIRMDKEESVTKIFLNPLFNLPISGDIRPDIKGRKKTVIRSFSYMFI
jgi:hypothetical protein